MGYNLGNQLPHAKGHVTSLFPADGGQIRTEITEFIQGTHGRRRMKTHKFHKYNNVTACVIDTFHKNVSKNKHVYSGLSNILHYKL